LAYSAADLDQRKAQRIEWHSLDARRNELPSQGVKKPVGRRVQQKPKLVGQKRWQLKRPALRATLKSLIRFSLSPRLTYQL
jgi:hypothetical protein